MKLFMSKKELEQAVENALEWGCVYHATGNYRKAILKLGKAYAYLDMLEKIDVWYEDTIINEHCHNMIMNLEDALYTIKYNGQKE